MNVLAVCAWTIGILLVLGVIVLPFQIGKHRDPYSAGHYVVHLIRAAIIIPVVGRVLGWW
jgi:fumarate reductase subunit D